MKTVTVKFPKSVDMYDYMCPDPVKAGQIVVVDAPRTGYTCAEVMKVEDGISARAYKRVVCVVDDTRYKAALEAEASRQQIIAELRKIEENVREEERLRYLADKDPRAKDLIERLDKLAA